MYHLLFDFFTNVSTHIPATAVTHQTCGTALEKLIGARVDGFSLAVLGASGGAGLAGRVAVRRKSVGSDRSSLITRFIQVAGTVLLEIGNEDEMNKLWNCCEIDLQSW